MNERSRQLGIRAVACLVAGGCVGSAGASPSLAVGLTVAVLAAGIGLLWPQPLSAPQHDVPEGADARARLLEDWAPLLTLLFFVPTLTEGVAPGADMAMHVGLARALVDGVEALSPAWGAVRAEAYPRGFSVWVAMVARAGVDLGHASLLVSALAFTLYYFGLRGFLRSVQRLPYPSIVAVLLTFACWTPQAFFRWGGGPSVLALALGLLAATELADALACNRTLAAVGSSAIAALMLVGAMWTHPIGAVMGAALVGLAMLVRGFHAPLRLLWLSLIAFVPLLPTMLWLSRHGPALSSYEMDWIRNFQEVNENVLGGWPRWLFPITVWRAAAVRLGVAVSMMYVASCGLLWRDREGRKRIWLSVVMLELLGVVLAYGERLPMIGFLIYPSRLMPLAAPIVAPPIAWAWRALSTRGAYRPAVWPAVTGVLAIGVLAVHLGVFQLAVPIATNNDLAVVRCLDQVVPPDAVIDGPYGDATQWLPALTGHIVTNPHIHCTLFDEVNAALAGRTPSYRFVGERVRYGDALKTPIPSGAPVCQAGKAALYRIEPPTERAR